MNEFLKLLELLPYRIQQPDLQEQGLSEFLELLLPSWGQATDDQILLIFVCVIGLVFLLSVFYFGWKTIRRQRLIKRLTEDVNEYNRSDNKPAQPCIKRQLKEKFDHQGALTEAWREFEDSLIAWNYNKIEIVYKTDEASFFFSEERLLEQHLNLRFWNSVPTLLVGLGILGTFVGLVWGLRSFSGIDEFTSAEMEKAIKELLPGVSTAFVTSVWGMFASLLFNGLEKWGIGRVSRTIADLQRALDQLFTLTRQEEIAIQSQFELEQQTQALKSFSTDLANDIKSAIAEGGQQILSELHNAPEAFSSSIAKQLAPTLQKLNITVETFLKQLGRLYQSLTQGHEQNTKERKEIIQEFHNASETFSSSMAKQLAPSFQKLNETIAKLLEEKEISTDAIKQIVNTLKQSVSTLLQQQGEQIKAINAQLSNSQAILARGQEMLNQMNTSVTSIRQLIETTRALSGQLMTGATQLENAGQQLTQASNAFSRENEKYLISNRETTEQIQAALQQSQKLLNDFTQRFQTIDAGLQGIFVTIEEGLNTYTITSRESINNYLSDFSNHLTQASDALARSVGFLGESVEELTNMNEQLTSQGGNR